MIRNILVVSLGAVAVFCVALGAITLTMTVAHKYPTTQTPAEIEGLEYWIAYDKPVLIEEAHGIIMYDTISKRCLLIPLKEDQEKIMQLLNKEK